MTHYNYFLNCIIDDGIAAVKIDYKDKPQELEGAIAGFEACRGKNPVELAQLLASARKATHEAYRDREVTDYWRIVCYEAEIEWTCNCVSAALANESLPVIVTPTARGMFKAAEILGVGVQEAQ